MWGAFAPQSPSLPATMTSIWACYLLSLLSSHGSRGPKSFPDSSDSQTLLRPGSRIRNPDPEGIKYNINTKSIAQIDKLTAVILAEAPSFEETQSTPRLQWHRPTNGLRLVGFDCDFRYALNASSLLARFGHIVTLCISTVGLRGTQHRFCPRSLAFSGATRAQRAGIPGIVYGQCLSRLDGYLDTRSKDSKSAQVCVCFVVASAYFVLDSYTQFPRCRYDHSRGIKVAIGLFGPSLCGTRDGPASVQSDGSLCDPSRPVKPDNNMFCIVLQHLWWTHKVQTCRCECRAMPEWLCSWLACLKIHK